MIYKRATARLKAAGIDDIVIKKGLWGPYPANTNATKQASRCFDTWQEAAEAVIAGYRPSVEVWKQDSRTGDPQ